MTTADSTLETLDPPKLSSRVNLEIEEVEEWKPPTVSLGRVPEVTPGRSGDKPIQGDFPLDQVVIDRKARRQSIGAATDDNKSYPWGL